MKVKQLNILLADDDKDDCDFFIDALEALPVSTTITTVHDGEELMKLLTNNALILPHVLFLDLNMPRKNGFECLYQIKQDIKLKTLPVVIFSTSFEQEVVNLLYNNGAQYFIRKPSEFELFKKIIHLTLTLINQDHVSQPGKEQFVLTVENNLSNQNSVKL
jgi:CheY-like chemotaxis protein